MNLESRIPVFTKLEAGKVLSCLRMQASPKAKQVKNTANAEIPAFAGMTEEKFSQLFDNVNPASSFYCRFKPASSIQDPGSGYSFNESRVSSLGLQFNPAR
ncbi:hypothetical protein KAX22_00125 [bacterium]|nr:hypothetical protein [bacterium]